MKIMGKKELKNRIQFTNTLEKELFSKLKEISLETMIPFSRLLDKGVEKVIEEYEDKVDRL